MQGNFTIFIKFIYFLSYFLKKKNSCRIYIIISFFILKNIINLMMILNNLKFSNFY